MSKGISVSLKELIQLRYEADHFDLFSKEQVKAQFGNNYLSAFRGRGMDFEEARAYQPGDDVRNIDWRVTARAGSVHTKVFREERERSVLLLVDFSSSMFFGTRVAFKSVVAARAAAILAWAAASNGDRIGGILFSDNKHMELRPHSKNFGVLQLLKNMVDMSRQNTKEAENFTLTDALRKLQFVAKPGGLIFILSDFSGLSQEAKPYLAKLASHSEVKAVFIYDIVEKEPPEPNRYAISNGTKNIMMNTAGRKFCQQYRDYFQQHLINIREILKKRRITLSELATDQSIAKILRDVL